MQNLRTVKFTLESQEDMTVGDHATGMSEKESEEITKTRDGYFLAWGNECFWNTGKLIERVVGIVEEIETGKVFHVIPKRITFVQSDSYHLV